LKKVFYKVSLCEYCQRQSCKPFTGLSTHAKNFRGDVPVYVKFGRDWPPPNLHLQKCRFSIDIRS